MATILKALLTRSVSGGDTGASRDADPRRDLARTGIGLTLWTTVTVLVVLLHNSRFSGSTLPLMQTLQSSAYGFGITLCFASIGALVGFLFGVPRTEQLEGVSRDKSLFSTEGNPRETPGVRQSVNTNVEKVSDWLTTIIVGIGLTQLYRFPEQLQRLATYYEQSGYVPGSFYVVVSLNSAVLGFFAGYLLTRLFLATAFIKADQQSRERGQVITEARQLERFNEHTAAIQKYEAALRTMKVDTPPEQKRAVLEGLVFNSLYEDPPEGFTKAIEYADRYLTEIGDSANPYIYAYLAAALGQKYRWDQEHNATKESLDRTRRSALDAVGKAIHRDVSTKNLLRRLLHPSEGSEDNDLAVFGDDDDFERILL